MTKFGIHSFFLVNALDHVYSEFDLTAVSQIIGRNNLGKTSFIRCLKFALIDNLSSGGHFGKYSWDSTLKYYFPATKRGNAWVVFRARSYTRGEVTIAVTRSDIEKNVVRVVIDRPLDKSDFVEERDVGGQKRLFSRSLTQLREHLMVERGLNEQDILIVRDNKEWRELLCDDPLLKHQGLGILPLKSKSASDFGQFRQMMSKALDVNNYELKNIKDALLLIAGISGSAAKLNFTGDTDTKQRFTSNLGDRIEAMLAVKLIPSFELIERSSEAATEVSKEIACFASSHRAALALRVDKLEQDIRYKDERLVALGKDKEKAQSDIDAARGALDALKAQMTRSEDVLTRHERDVAAVNAEIEASLDQRSVQELDEAIAGLHGRARAASNVKSKEFAQRDVRGLERDVQAARIALEHAKGGVETFGAYLSSTYDANVLATLREVLHPGVFALPSKDVISNESLLASIGSSAVGSVVDLELLRAKVVGAGADELVLDEAALEENLAGLQAKLQVARAALVDSENAESIQTEINRLQELRDLRKRLASLMSEQEAQAIEAAKREVAGLKSEISKSEQAMRSLEQVKSKIEDDYRALTLRSDAKLLASMKLALEQMANDDRYHVQGGNSSDLLSTNLSNEEFLDAYSEKRTELANRYRSHIGAMIKERDKNSADYSALVDRLTGDASLSVITYERPWLSGSDLMAKLSDVIKKSEVRLETANKQLAHLLVEQSHLANNFVRNLDLVSKVVNGLSAKLKSLRISNLTDLGIELVRNNAQLEKLRKLVSAGGSIDSVMDGDNLIDGKSVVDYFHDMLDSGSSIYHLEEMFELNIYTVNHAGVRVQSSSASGAGSEGTVTMIQILLSVLLVGRLFDPALTHEFVVPAYVDEAAKIDKQNIRTLTRCMTENGFVTAFAHPFEAVLPMYGVFHVYEMRYLPSKTGEYHYVGMTMRRITDKRKDEEIAVLDDAEVVDEPAEQLA
mgnify:CR=1 FL=1